MNPLREIIYEDIRQGELHVGGFMNILTHQVRREKAREAIRRRKGSNHDHRNPG
jgi:hypothetical protein